MSDGPLDFVTSHEVIMSFHFALGLIIVIATLILIHRMALFALNLSFILGQNDFSMAELKRGIKL